MGIFDNAKSLTIDNKDVKMLKLDGATVFRIIDGIELTSDKTVLSYYDSDSCTLSAQLVDCEGNPMLESGKTIEFFKDNVSIGTATTNSNGIATKTINSNNEGTITFKAEYNSFTSNNITIEDIYKYYDCKTNDGNWNVPTRASVSFNSNDGAYILGTAKTVTQPAYTIQCPTGSYSVELEITEIQVSSTLATQIGVEGVYLTSAQSRTELRYYNNAVGVSTTFQLRIGDIIKFEYDKTNNIVTAYVNNQLIGSIEADSTYPGLTFRTYLDRCIGVKNMKIKEL